MDRASKAPALLHQRDERAVIRLLRSAGNQDGDKRIKQAEDVAAMGKITEILGKRSATITKSSSSPL